MSPPTPWIATRHEALTRLAAFVPSAGRAYAAKRNFDFGPGRHASVSTLSPYIRHRLITESDVVEAVLAAHSPAAAEKFVQEVCWRTYWKGWLEQRPQVWDAYLDELENARARLRTDDAFAAEIAAAERGASGIACMDAWASELIETGYLHNHARMWFASVWIFTLRLPWVLGADFFYRHLLDGDAASNTLSWRWVAGLHTRGKTYLARADNIATYTDGRFKPDAHDLAAFAQPLDDEPAPERTPLRHPDTVPSRASVILLVTEDDLSPESWPIGDAHVCGVASFTEHDFGPNLSTPVRAFKASALEDAVARASTHWNAPVQHCRDGVDLATFAKRVSAEAAVTTIVPVGYLKSAIDEITITSSQHGLPVLQISRRWDSLFWPHAKAGFFQLKERIPATLAKLDLIPLERQR